MTVVTRSNYNEHARTQDHRGGQHITKYRQKSQPCTGGSNQNRIGLALAAESRRCAVGAQLTIILLLLDLAGIAGVIYLVVDDIQEALIVVAFIMVVHFGQYLVFRRIRLQLAKHEQSKSLILFSRIRQAQMYHSSLIVEGKRPTYEILQVWFANKPELPSDTSVAKDVTAKIKIYKDDQSEFLEYLGQWAKSNAPDNVGFDDILDNVNISPSHLEAKLIVALKYPSDSDCYSFTREGMRSTPDGRSSQYKIPEGDYRVQIHLQGIGVDKVFWFNLKNLGSGKNLEMKFQNN